MCDLKLTDGDLTLSPRRRDDVDARRAGEDELLVCRLNGGPGSPE